MPDRPVGRKQILTPPNTKQYLIDNDIDIPLYQPKSLKEYKELNNIKVDFIVVAAYGNILPLHILNIAPCINLHASILPTHRGASPIQSSILNNETFTGVTSMLMNEGLDTGDILAFSFIDSKNKKSNELFDELGSVASNLTIKTLKNFYQIKPLSQFDFKSNHCKKISKKDALVDFSDALTLSLKYRAFYPWPGINLENGLKLKKLTLKENTSINKQGEILGINKSSILVGCQTGSIEIQSVAAPSKKEVDSLSYIRGKRLNLGDTLC